MESAKPVALLRGKQGFGLGHHRLKEILQLGFDRLSQWFQLGQDRLRQGFELLLEVGCQGFQLFLDLLQQWLHLGPKAEEKKALATLGSLSVAMTHVNYCGSCIKEEISGFYSDSRILLY